MSSSDLTEKGAKVVKFIDSTPFDRPMKKLTRKDILELMEDQRGDINDFLKTDKHYLQQIDDIDHEPMIKNEEKSKKIKLPLEREDGQIDIPNFALVKNAVQAEYAEANKYSIPSKQTLVKPN